MDTRASGIDAATDLARAGFWRRLLATIIDTIVVMLPFQLLAAVLFAMTAGMVQMQSGFFGSCGHGGKDQISEELRPLAPRDSNFITVCRTSFLGATTGRTLTVGRATREGNLTTTVTMSYMQDKEGSVVKGTDIGWIFYLTLMIYLVAMISNSGKTLGGRAVRLRVIDATNPDARGVPLRKAVIRYLVMFIGVVPGVVFYAYQYWSKGGIADAMFTADSFPVFAAAAVFSGLWALALAIQIAKKIDPIYDRAAGTAVIRA
jgi:uncharacterized RDD family membrane protein YckC